MSDFDFSTLITDRTKADVSTLSTLLSKKMETWTPEELEKFNNGLLKGGYWWTDLNRVTACMEYLDEELRGLGYESGYSRIEIDHGETSSPGKLPEGYTELEYIEGIGTQYIDTKIPPSPTVILKASINIVSLPQNAWVLCSRIANGQGQFGILAQTGSNTLRVDYGQTNANLQIPQVVGPLSIEMGADHVDINGVTHSFAHQMFTSSYPIAVLAGNSGGTVSGWCNARLESLTVSDGDAAKFNGVPCKNQSGEVGLYDTVSGQFFKNAGSGSFVAGPVSSGNEETEQLDPYTWYESDVPTASQMAQYLANVAAIRSVFTLQEYAPQTPQSMALLNFAKANDIESVLRAVEDVITIARKTLVACGPATCGGDYL